MSLVLPWPPSRKQARERPSVKALMFTLLPLSRKQAREWLSKLGHCAWPKNQGTIVHAVAAANTQASKGAGRLCLRLGHSYRHRCHRASERENGHWSRALFSVLPLSRKQAREWSLMPGHHTWSKTETPLSLLLLPLPTRNQARGLAACAKAMSLVPPLPPLRKQARERPSIKAPLSVPPLQPSCKQAREWL